MNTTLTIAISTFAPHPPIASIAKRHRPQRQEQLEEGEVQIVEIGDIPGDSPKPVLIPPRVGTLYLVDISHYRQIQTPTLPAYSPCRGGDSLRPSPMSTVHSPTTSINSKTFAQPY